MHLKGIFQAFLGIRILSFRCSEFFLLSYTLKWYLTRNNQKDLTKMYIPINCYLKGITSSHSRKTMQGKLSQEIKTLKLFYTDVNLTEWKLMNSPNTISSTFVSWKPNTFSAWHVIIPWSSKRTSLIANWSAVIVWWLWSPPFLPCTDHLMFGVGLPDAEALSDKFPPSCIEICDGGLLVNRGGATDEIWKHINNIQKKHTSIKNALIKNANFIIILYTP